MDDSRVMEALLAQRLRIVFQPQFQLPSLRLQGFEALVRLCVGDERWVEPERFLSQAQDAGLMQALTLHMVEAACKALACWRQAGRSSVFVAVNIEADDLADVCFAPRVCRLLAQYRVRAGELELELVERRFLHLGDVARTNIAQLRTAGIRLAMDDFGTGHSALSQLGELPFDVIKIDKAFLHRVPEDPLACTLLVRVIHLCSALQKQVVVEGVESQLQLQWLSDLSWGRLRLQGNGLSLPLPEPLARECIPTHAAP